jgi:hypothetical protein
MRLIVCDTGPLLHLQEAGLLELLQKSSKVTAVQHNLERAFKIAIRPQIGLRLKALAED